MIKTRKALTASILTAVSVFAAGCSSTNTPSEDAIQATGSATVEPVASYMANRYDFDVNVEAIGSTDGFEKFCNGEADVNDASVAIPGSGAPVDFQKQCADNKVEYIELPTIPSGTYCCPHGSSSRKHTRGGFAAHLCMACNCPDYGIFLLRLDYGAVARSRRARPSGRGGHGSPRRVRGGVRAVSGSAAVVGDCSRWMRHAVVGYSLSERAFVLDSTGLSGGIRDLVSFAAATPAVDCGVDSRHHGGRAAHALARGAGPQRASCHPLSAQRRGICYRRVARAGVFLPSRCPSSPAPRPH